MIPTNEHLAGATAFIGQMRLDLAATYEEGHDTPVYFRNLHLLEDFVNKCRFTAKEIRGVNFADAKYIVGGAPGTAYAYGTVWAKVALERKKVRSALVNTVIDCYHLPEEAARIIQADHLCNKGSVIKNPDGWLLIFPTISEVNVRSGSNFERGLRVDPNVGVIKLTPFHFFKMLSNYWPKNREEFENGMKIIDGQNMIDGMGQKIRDHVGERFKFPEIE